MTLQILKSASHHWDCAANGHVVVKYLINHQPAVKKGKRGRINISSPSPPTFFYQLIRRHLFNDDVTFSSTLYKKICGARNRFRIGLSYRPARARICKRLWSPESIPQKLIPPGWEPLKGALKGLQIWALCYIGWRNLKRAP